MMKGSISVDSTPGQGSIFSLQMTFKYKESKPDMPQPEVTLSEVPVLIVDDNAQNCLIVMEYLRSWHIPGASAASGQEALKMMRHAAEIQNPFKIIVIDYFMPEMNGAKLAELIKSDEALKDAYLILVSFGILTQELEPSEQNYFVTGLTKPIRVSLFLQTLTEVWCQTGNLSHVPEEIEAEKQKPESLDADVLLVEDSLINQRVAAGILRRLGCRVDIAENGKEGVDCFQRKNYDIIFMDANMPEMDGFEATGKIREYEAGLRVTGYGLRVNDESPNSAPRNSQPTTHNPHPHHRHDGLGNGRRSGTGYRRRNG